MRFGSKVAVVLVTALAGLGLAACDEDQSLPELNLTGVHVQTLNGPSSWPQDGIGMAGELAVASELPTLFKGKCTLRIPASPIDSRDARTQILIPLTAIAIYQRGDYPVGVNPALVPPGTYDADVNCTGNRRSSLVQVTLTGSTNVLQSITSSQNFVATLDQVLTVNATNMGNGCTLKFAGPAPGTGAPAVLELDVTSAASVDGVVTSGTAPYDSSQTTLETHTNWTSTLDCPGRENSGTVTVNFH